MAINKLTLTKEELIELYWKQGYTLQRIGDIDNLSRERIRQVMEKCNVPRLTSKNGRPRIEDFATYANNGHTKDDGKVLRRIVDLDKCENCGRDGVPLHIHHIRYPAKTRSDVEILCVKCHKKEHPRTPLAWHCSVYLAYQSGISTKELSVKYNTSRINIYKIIERWRSAETIQ